MNDTLTLKLSPMPLPRLRFTIRRLMIAVVIVAVELGCGLFIHREVNHSDLSVFAWWIETGIQLAFANLLIGISAYIFVDWVHNFGRLEQEISKDR